MFGWPLFGLLFAQGRFDDDLGFDLGAVLQQWCQPNAMEMPALMMQGLLSYSQAARIQNGVAKGNQGKLRTLVRMILQNWTRNL